MSAVLIDDKGKLHNVTGMTHVKWFNMKIFPTINKKRIERNWERNVKLYKKALRYDINFINMIESYIQIGKSNYEQASYFWRYLSGNYIDDVYYWASPALGILNCHTDLSYTVFRLTSKDDILDVHLKTILKLIEYTPNITVDYYNIDDVGSINSNYKMFKKDEFINKML